MGSFVYLCGKCKPCFVTLLTGKSKIMQALFCNITPPILAPVSPLGAIAFCIKMANRRTVEFSGEFGNAIQAGKFHLFGSLTWF